MKIKVKKGYVSHERKLFGAGAVLDISDDVANRLIASATAEAVSKNHKKPEKPKAEEKAEQPKQKAKAKKQEPAVEEELGIELPAADPVASVKKRERK